jgi:hypothetical protein
LAALAFAREVGKESSPGCAIWFGNSGTVNRMEPEGFKRRIALVADSDRFYDATVVMIRRQRQEREALLVAEFYKSFNEQKAAAALLTVERIKGFSQEVANITEQRLRDFDHPTHQTIDWCYLHPFLMI